MNKSTEDKGGLFDVEAHLRGQLAHYQLLVTSHGADVERAALKRDRALENVARVEAALEKLALLTEVGDGKYIFTNEEQGDD